MANEFDINIVIANLAQIRQQLSSLTVNATLGGEFKLLESWAKNGLTLKINLVGTGLQQLLDLQKNGINVNVNASGGGGRGGSGTGGGTPKAGSDPVAQAILARGQSFLQTHRVGGPIARFEGNPEDLGGLTLRIDKYGDRATALLSQLNAAEERLVQQEKHLQDLQHKLTIQRGRAALTTLRAGGDTSRFQDIDRYLSATASRGDYLGDQATAVQAQIAKARNQQAAQNQGVPYGPPAPNAYINGQPVIYSKSAINAALSQANAANTGGAGGGGGGGGSSSGNSGGGIGGFGNLELAGGLYSINQFRTAILTLTNPLKDASEAAYKFEASIVATVGTLQATTRIVGPNGQQVDPGTQLKEQFRIATGLEKTARASLAPIGVGGAEQSLLTNTFIQAQTTKTGQATSEQDLKTSLPRLVAAIKVLAPNLGETREAKELRDIILNQRVGQITAGPGIRALAPDLAKARTSQEFEEATRPLEAYITALKEGNTPLAERLKLEGEFHIAQQDAGEAFNQALLPSMKALEEIITDPAFAEGMRAFAQTMGEVATQALKFAKNTAQNGKNTDNFIADQARSNPNYRNLLLTPGASLVFPGAAKAISDSDTQDAQLASLQLENQRRREGKVNFNNLKTNPPSQLTSEANAQSKLASLLNSLEIDKDKFNKTNSSDLGELGSQPLTQISQGQGILSKFPVNGPPAIGLSPEGARDTQLGALRLIAGGQEKLQAERDKQFNPNLVFDQANKNRYDVSALQSRISTQQDIVSNRRAALDNETDTGKKELRFAELGTEVDKLKQLFTELGTATQNVEKDTLRIAKAFNDVAVAGQNVGNFFAKYQIQLGAATDLVEKDKRERQNFADSGKLRDLTRQQGFISAAGKYGAAGGTLTGADLANVPGLGATASQAALDQASKGLQAFKDGLEEATNALKEFKDDAQARTEDRESSVYSAQQALEQAQSSSEEGLSGSALAQRQRDINSAQRAFNKARDRQFNAPFEEDKREENKLSASIPSLATQLLGKGTAGEEANQAGRTVAQGATVDAETYRELGRKLESDTIALKELPLTATNTLLTELNALLAAKQAVGQTSASAAASQEPKIPGAEGLDKEGSSGSTTSNSNGADFLQPAQAKLNTLYNKSKDKFGPFVPKALIEKFHQQQLLEEQLQSTGSEPPSSLTIDGQDKFNAGEFFSGGASAKGGKPGFKASLPGDSSTLVATLSKAQERAAGLYGFKPSQYAGGGYPYMDMGGDGGTGFVRPNGESDHKPLSKKERQAFTEDVYGGLLDSDISKFKKNVKKINLSPNNIFSDQLQASTAGTGQGGISKSELTDSFSQALDRHFV